MALIKGKQIQSLVAAKIVESPERQFASAAEKAAYAGKAEVAQVEAAKQELVEAIAAEKLVTTEAIAAEKKAREESVAAEKLVLTQAIATEKQALEAVIAAEKLATTEKFGLVDASILAAKAEVGTAAKNYTDAEVVKIETSIALVDGKVATNAGAITTGLGERYTKDEVDSKMAQLASGILYKGTVGTYSEIATKYLVPVQGWLVAVEDTNKFYVFSDTEGWEEFPIEVEACTTHAKNIALSVMDNQTVIKTGIRTDGTGALQTSTVLAQEITMIVNGYAQTKGIDYTVAIVADEIEITWLVVDFALEQSDAISITYNQTV